MSEKNNSLSNIFKKACNHIKKGAKPKNKKSYIPDFKFIPPTPPVPPPAKVADSYANSSFRIVFLTL